MFRGSSHAVSHGLGIEKPDDVSRDDDEYDAYRKRMMLAYRFRPNPLVRILSSILVVNTAEMINGRVFGLCRTILDGLITELSNKGENGRMSRAASRQGRKRISDSSLCSSNRLFCIF